MGFFGGKSGQYDDFLNNHKEKNSWRNFFQGPEFSFLIVSGLQIFIFTSGSNLFGALVARPGVREGCRGGWRGKKKIIFLIHLII